MKLKECQVIKKWISSFDQDLRRIALTNNKQAIEGLIILVHQPLGQPNQEFPSLNKKENALTAKS